jgi:hypothetical protein
MTTLEALQEARKQYAAGTVVLGDLFVALDAFLAEAAEPAPEEDE